MSGLMIVLAIAFLQGAAEVGAHRLEGIVQALPHTQGCDFRVYETRESVAEEIE